MRRMGEMANRKTISIMLHGVSIHELELRIPEFAEKDWIWVSVNMFRLMEINILSRINKQLTIVQCGGRIEITRRISSVLEFLSRDTKNMFITTIKALAHITKPQNREILRHKEKVQNAP